MQKQHGTGTSRSQGSPGCVGRLAEFFPSAVPVRIPVQVMKIDVPRVDGMAAPPAEHTVIEFGTPGEVIFASGLPLDFEDTVRVKNFDGSFDVSAEIIAMQLDKGNTAVAARFLEDVTNWIIK
ncbi:MAG TPA: hypothetical protein VFR08_08105 [Candidatus Angelobacter sp.]|nr:hypothetical protein [Candidatus Angelobacter sp.]